VRLSNVGPRTVFGRLALLLVAFALFSQVLSFALVFGWTGPPPDGPPHGPPLAGFAVDVGVRLGALILAAWIGSRWLAKPMKQLAEAARRLGNDIAGPPLQVLGPLECRETITVFNRMHAQIQAHLSDRDRFVAAVSHDLRTPLTRMRLRTESLPIDASPGFRADIREMNDMITTTLDYLRGAADPEPFERVDLEALLRGMADDESACGRELMIDGHAAPINGQATSLRRACGNLIENARRYGGGGSVRLVDSDSLLTIEVRDEGAGLPEAELEKVLAPFYRFESSRNRESGGVGLGLSIAADIACRHGGSLRLANRATGGLTATLTLPRRRMTS
jgi:protein-histidine pros-kinase